LPPQNGTKVKKDLNGIISTTKIPKKHYTKKLKELVIFVEKLFSPIKEMVMPFVQTTANQHGEKNQALMILNESVSYVPKHLQQINTQKFKPVLVFAGENYVIGIKEIKYLKERRDVYCLEVEGTHTFALKNGVIVSNCGDSMRYLLSRKLTSMKRRAVKN
jgi:intein/homing endonuclease